jgi:hypothetical protein
MIIDMELKAKEDGRNSKNCREDGKVFERESRVVELKDLGLPTSKNENKLSSDGGVIASI